jgi:hypothetical protein
VVVGVDEARRDERAAELDGLVGVRRRAVADRLEQAVPDQQPTRVELTFLVVHGDDEAVAVEDRARHAGDETTERSCGSFVAPSRAFFTSDEQKLR